MSDLGRPVGALGPRILRGMELNLIAQAGSLAVALYFTPKLVHGLGPAGYAVYALAWVLLGYSTLLSLGTMVGVQHYTALRRGLGKGPGGLLPYVLAFQFAAACLGALALAVGSRWVALSFLNVDAPMLDSAARSVALAAAAVPCHFVVLFAANVLYGLERFAGYNALMTLPQAAVTAAAGLLASAGLGPEAAVLAVVAVHLAAAAVGLFLIRGELAAPELERAEAARFARFSLDSFAAQALWQAKFQGDKAFIGKFLPLAHLAYYAVPSSMAQKFNALYGAVNTAAFPMMTELHARGERERLKRLYLKSTELMLFAVAPLTALAFVLVPQFLTLWLGPEFSARGTWPFRMLLLANAVYLGTYLSNAAALGQGAPRPLGGLLAVQTAMLALVWSVAVPRWGINGAAAGLLLVELLCVPVFLQRVHRRFLDLGWGEFLAACWRPLCAGAAVAAAGIPVHGRVGSWGGLAAGALLGVVLYAAAAWALVERADRELLKDWLKAKIAA